MEIIIGIVVGLAVGAAIVALLMKKGQEKKAAQIIKDAEADAEVIKKEKILQAKEKFLQLKEEHEKVINERNSKLLEAENRIKQKENSLNQKLADVNKEQRSIDTVKQNLSAQLEASAKKQEELDKSGKKLAEKLENISGLSVEVAKAQLIETLKDEAKTNSMAYIKEIQDEAKLEANKEAKKIVIQSIQRVATEQAIENSVTVFNIENDDVKGRIIGREGRNIRAIEAATGVDLIVDDTPEAIILSSFAGLISSTILRRIFGSVK